MKFNLPFANKFLKKIDQQEVVQYALQLQEEMNKPPEGEKTAYSSTSYQSFGGILYNPDKLTMLDYQEMRIDGQINLGLQFCKLPILALDYTVECKDKKIADAVYTEIKRIYRDMVDKMLRALDYGYSVMEKVWGYQKETGLWGYKKLKDPDITTIELKTDGKGNFNGFKQVSPATVDIEAEKAFVFTHRLENGNLYGISRTKSAYPYYYASKIMLLFANRYMERNADPFKIIRYPKDNNIDKNVHPNLDRALALIEQVKGGSGIALPSDLDKEKDKYLWEITYVEDNQRNAQYINYMNFLNTMKLRSVIVPERTVSQDNSTGSYGMAEAHTKLFLLSEEGLIADIEDCINRYLIPQFVKYNFGDTAPKASLKIASIQDKHRTFLEDIIKEIIRNPNIIISDIIDVDRLRQELSLPAPKEEGAAGATGATAEHNHKHSRKINLDNSKFWRQPTKFEDKIDLEEIDDTLNKIEDGARKETTEILGWIKESAIRYLTGVLDDKNINSINNFKVKYRNDYGKIFKTYEREAYNKGVKSIVDEFKAKVKDWTLPQEEIQWLNSKADTISWKHLDDLEYRIIQACLSGLSNQKTAQTILMEVRDVFTKFINNDLEKAITTEFTTAFNKGRSYVAQLLVE